MEYDEMNESFFTDEQLAYIEHVKKEALKEFAANLKATAFKEPVINERVLFEQNIDILLKEFLRE